MTEILVGCKNFDFFTKKLLEDMTTVIVASETQDIPSWLTNNSRVIRVKELYDSRSKTLQLDGVQALLMLRALGDVDGSSHVFCNQEANLEVAEQIRRELGSFDHLKGKTECFREKPLMKDAILSAGLRAPRYCVLASNPDTRIYKSLVETIGLRMIIKPCASVGSRGVYKVFTRSDFDDFVRDSANDGCTYEAEEFIDGTLLEFDFAMQRNVCLARAVSRYSCPMADLQEGCTLASIMITPSSDLFKKIEAFGLACAEALEAKDGCFHMELFLTKEGELVFLEIAARSPGLLTVPAYKSWLGINFYDIELFIQLDRDAAALACPDSSFFSRPAFFAVFPKLTGIVTNLHVPILKGEYQIKWRVKVDEAVVATNTNIDYAGLLFLTANNEEDAISDFNYLIRDFVPVSYAR